MALHLHPMLSLTANRGINVVSSSAPNGRQQAVHPPAPVRDLGPRAMQRLMALKREEQEQELEDLESLKMTEEQRLILEQSFASVKFEVADLDGLSWSSPNGQYMLARWYTFQVAAIRDQLGLLDDDFRDTSDYDDIEYEEYVDCEPPPSSASDCTIVPDREDIPSVDIEPPSPPPTARATHIPPPLVWPTDHSGALSPRGADIYIPRSPRSPSSPLAPGTLRRHRGRAYPHTLRRTPTHRVFSVPACASPHRENIPLDRHDTVRVGHADAALTLSPKSAGAMPKPMVRQLAIDPRPLAYGSEPMPDSPTLGPVPPQKRKTTGSSRVASSPTGSGTVPIPPPLERTLSECPEGPLSPDAFIHHGLGDFADQVRGLFSAQSEMEEGAIIAQNDGAQPGEGGGGGLAMKLAGLRIALPGLSSFPGRALGMWGASASDSQGAVDELMPPLQRMGPAMGLRRGEIEDPEAVVAWR